MRFNLRANMLDEFFRARIGPKVTAPLWVAHQLENTANVYLPTYRQTADRKPISRIGFELAALTAQWRCLPFHYFRYELYRTGVNLASAAAYVPDTVFYSRLLPAVNRSALLLDDKIACKRILGDAGVPQPLLLMTGEQGSWFDRVGRPVPADSPAAVDAALGGIAEVVIKPARHTSGGAGVLVLDNEGGELLQQDGTPFSLAAYGARWGGWLIEAFVRQHDELAAFNPYSLNTFRVITHLHPADGPRVLYCLLKSSADTDAVDNACNGGLYVRVDTATGMLDDTAHTTSLTRYTHHPVSGLAFAGQKISTIRQVVEAAERAAVHFPRTPVVGWDIAVDHDAEALIIEGNSSPSLMNLQRTHGGLSHTLGRSLITDHRRS
ncbi:sugar-transfer associated ATP-grasp domain-containing protein [Kitasatospora sp. NPDC088351]|uniref:sugar-transfer associated ATP-grasp domain-containing protein n=1 Tax=Kitasatospora sp. NPDC088351 TaxID=3155180 RepID=UPI0034335F5B